MLILCALAKTEKVVYWRLVDLNNLKRCNHVNDNLKDKV